MYFNNFSKIIYSFGDEGERATMQDLSSYAEVIDKIKDNSAFYNNYYIKDGDRPDMLAFAFYKNPHLYWTFYMMNDKLRDQGWPLDRKELDEKILEDFPNLVLETSDDIFMTFKVGQVVQGNSGTGTVAYRNLDLGQIVLTDVTGTFNTGETVTSNDSLESVDLTSVVSEHLSVRYYDDNDLPVTNSEYYNQQNTELRSIMIMKPSAVNRVAKLFYEAMGT